MRPNGAPIGAAIGAAIVGNTPIGAPFGRKIAFGGSSAFGAGDSERDPACSSGDPGVPRRSQWDERGDGDASTDTTAPAAPARSRPSMWDARSAAGPGASTSAGPSRPSQWDEKGTTAREGAVPPGPIGASRPVVTQPLPTGGGLRVLGAARPAVAASPVPAAHSSSANGDAGGELSSAGSGTWLYLSGLSLGATEAVLRRLFDQAGVAVATVQPRDKMTASVELRIEATEDAEVAADFAVHRVNGALIFGRPVSVEVETVAEGAGAKVAPVGIAPRAKTQMCQYWMEGRCTRGAICTFAHGEQELESPAQARARLAAAAAGKGVTPPIGRPAVPTPPPQPIPGLSKDPKFTTNRKTQICVYWKEGRCTRGPLCSFAHGEEELAGDQQFRTGKQIAESMREKLKKDLDEDERDRDGSRKDGDRRGDRERDRERDGDRRGDRRDGRGGSRSRKGRDAGRKGRSRSSAKKVKRIVFAKKDTLKAVIRVECKAAEEERPRSRSPSCEAASPTDLAATQEAPSPAPYLINEDGLAHLAETYGLGVKMLQAMGWKAGSGLGKKAEGWLEPVCVQLPEHPLTRRGRKDRRCVGAKAPKRFLDSDASESARSESTASKKSKSSSSRKSSKSKSKSTHRPRKKKRRRRNKRSSSTSSKKTSSSSSKSGSSSSSRKKRRRKFRRTRATTSPPKPAAAASAGVAGAAGAAAGAASTPAAAGAPGANEPPEIQQAKKQVLAKLTVLKNVEPKEERAKQFRLLLREWHPDKNPERLEMATAVFQFLQKGKSLLSLGAAAK